MITITKTELKQIIREVILKETSSNNNEELQKIANVVQGKSLMSMRQPLETIYKKRDIDFVNEPYPCFLIKSKNGKVIAIVNKKYIEAGDKDTVISGEYAIGYIN